MLIFLIGSSLPQEQLGKGLLSLARQVPLELSPMLEFFEGRSLCYFFAKQAQGMGRALEAPSTLSTHLRVLSRHCFIRPGHLLEELDGPELRSPTHRAMRHR